MKILFAIDTLGSGGKERRLTELIKAFAVRKDIEIELVLMSEEIHYNEVLDLSIIIHKIIRRSKKDPVVFHRFYKLIRNIRPDIVHCWDSMTAVYVAPACKLLGCKLVNGMVIDSPVQQNLFNKHWLRGRLVFPFSDVIIGNSEAGLDAYKAPGDKRILIHNGFDFKRLSGIIEKHAIKELYKIDTDYVVGMVARFSKMKDYPTYFKAAALVLQRRNDITFLAIGSGTDSEEASNMIDKQYSRYFRLLGEHTDVESLINMMDVAVLSTFTEGISNSILEYMALGKPVIATRGGGTEEIVKDRETGFLIGPSDPGELACKVELLLDDPVLRRRMGTAGRERIKDNFSIDKMVKEYAEIYSGLL